MDVFVRNMSDYPDRFFDMLRDIGGMGVLRFHDDLWFLFPSETRDYLIYTHMANQREKELIGFSSGERGGETTKRLADRAHQLFHVRFQAGLDIDFVMH